MQSSHANLKGNGRLRRRYLARRLEILRAAGEEFRTNGFAETGMRDIAQAASLSPGNLYNYFQGKHEILYFCQDNSLDRMLASLEKSRRLRTAAAERLRFVIVSHVRCVLDEVEGSAAHLLTSALPPRLQRSLMAKRDRYEEGVRQLIVAGTRSGEFIPCDPALVARAVLGALNWSVRWFSPEGSMTATEIAEGFADYLIRGLLAKPNAARRAAFAGNRHPAAHKILSARAAKRAAAR
ncbi:MAG TPA: TetR/AcrR family transcriptional regulator [Candidatus Angelobacter sp.]|nr:TetR/AcrR family transcriptional regulator [Candidatus Angelobacter sp.]